MTPRIPAKTAVWAVLAALVVLPYREAMAEPPWPITVTTCKGFTVGRAGDGTVRIRCPGQPLDRPLLTIPGACCPNARVVARTATTVTIDCKP